MPAFLFTNSHNVPTMLLERIRLNFAKIISGLVDLGEVECSRFPSSIVVICLLGTPKYPSFFFYLLVHCPTSNYLYNIADMLFPFCSVCFGKAKKNEDICLIVIGSRFALMANPNALKMTHDLVLSFYFAKQLLEQNSN